MIGYSCWSDAHPFARFYSDGSDWIFVARQTCLRLLHLDSFRKMGKDYPLVGWKMEMNFSSSLCSFSWDVNASKLSFVTDLIVSTLEKGMKCVEIVGCWFMRKKRRYKEKLWPSRRGIIRKEDTGRKINFTGSGISAGETQMVQVHLGG